VSLSKAELALAKRVAIAMRNDVEGNDDLIFRFSEMTPAEVKRFILEDMKLAFSKNGYQPVRFQNLATVLEDVAGSQVHGKGMGQSEFDFGSAITAVLGIATSAGAVYIQKKSADDAKKFLSQQQDIQALQARLAKSAAVAAQAQAASAVTQAKKEEAKAASSVMGGVPVWVWVAGGAVLLVGGFFMMKQGS
jgi:hypothetical protein